MTTSTPFAASAASGFGLSPAPAETPIAVEPRDQFRIVELASSELWNLRDVNSALLREAVMAMLLHELLLFSCMAAFAIGVVIAAASIFG